MQSLTRILPFARQLLERVVTLDDVVVDATAGNGHDTIFLAGLAKHVHSFDIQKQAISSTRLKVSEGEISNVTLHHTGHENVLQFVQGPLGAAIFNLGYLPGSDESVTTHGPTTWKAITDILSILKKNGVAIVVVYHGHENGKVERHYLEERISQLDGRTFQVLKYQFANRPASPYILAVERLFE